MTTALSPAVLVLNDRYLPDHGNAPAMVGATSFALDVIRCLKAASAFAGVILYRRREALTAPRSRTTSRGGIPCVVLEFNFRMPRALVRDALTDAVSRLPGATSGPQPPILYFQSDTLLPYTPPDLVACVTHHGPFFEDFARHFSVPAACEAFGGRQAALHFRDQQRAALRELVTHENLYVIQHSQVQRRCLIAHGVSEERILAVSPPVSRSHPGGAPLDGRLRSFVASSPLLLYTAAARLDFFKNIDLLIDSGVLLLRRGVPVKVLVVGGATTDGGVRDSLLKHVPARFADRFLAVERLPKDQLYTLFRTTRGHAIFVFPSRYETLGITPLEAALHGVTTVISDSPRVEASRFFPASARFEPTAHGLASTVRRLSGTDLQHQGEDLRRRITRQVSVPLFYRDLLRAWRTCSARASAHAGAFSEAPHTFRNAPQTEQRKAASWTTTSWSSAAPASIPSSMWTS